MSHTLKLKHLIAVSASVAVLIAGLSCSSGTGSNAVNNGVATPISTVTPTPARAAATTMSLVNEDPRKQYFVIKQTFSKRFADASLPKPPDGEAYDLEDCSSGIDGLGLADDDPIIPLVNLAHDIARLKFTIPKLGYPESSWRPVLVTYETRQLELSIREMGKKFADTQGQRPLEESHERFKKDLSSTLADYRLNTNPNLRQIVYEGDCGAGEITIYVKTDPPNGRVRMMPVFFYELCIAQQLDPEDASVCTRWKDAVEGLGLEVAGEYYYRVTWPENVQQNGRISFDSDKDQETITFRKQ